MRGEGKWNLAKRENEGKKRKRKRERAKSININLAMYIDINEFSCDTVFADYNPRSFKK